MLTGEPISAVGPGLKRRLFTVSLLLSTWIPMACLVAIGFSETPGPGLQAAKAALLFVNGLHVTATLCLYMDRQFLRVIRDDRVRYIYAPIALILGSGVIFALASPEVQAYWLLVYWAWQAYHYGRQNVGIYALTSIAEERRSDRVARRVLELATACAVCGTFRILGLAVAPSFLHGAFEWLYRAAAWAFVGLVAFSLYHCVARRRDASPLQAVTFLTMVLFFAPIFLSTNTTVAFSSYAVAHGIQYIFIVTVLTASLGRSEGRGGMSGTVALLFLAMGLLGGLVYLKDIGWGGSSAALRGGLDFAAGMALGTAAAHFVVDAGAWRLSQPSIRAYMTRRFGFLLGSARLRSARA